MIKSKFRRFIPMANIDYDEGYGMESPRPPPKVSPPKEEAPKGVIMMPRPPPPKRIPFRVQTVPDDTWHRCWALGIERHTGVRLPPLPPRPEKQKPEETPKKIPKNKKYVFPIATPSIRQQVRARSDNLWIKYTEFHKMEASKKRDKETEERNRKAREHEQAVRERMESHRLLVSTMATTMASIAKTEAEAQSVVFTIRDHDRTLRTLQGRQEELELEINALKAEYKKMEECSELLETVPPELWETLIQKLDEVLPKGDAFQSLEETDLEYVELTLHAERGNLLFLKTITMKMALLRKRLRNLSRLITLKTELIERLDLEIVATSQKKNEDKERLSKIKAQAKKLRQSHTALQKKDMELLNVIMVSG